MRNIKKAERTFIMGELMIIVSFCLYCYAKVYYLLNDSQGIESGLRLSSALRFNYVLNERVGGETLPKLLSIHFNSYLSVKILRVVLLTICALPILVGTLLLGRKMSRESNFCIASLATASDTSCKTLLIVNLHCLLATS